MVGVINNVSELQHVLAQNPNNVVCVKFSAKWCAPCKKIQPFLENLAGQHSDMKVYVTDVDNSPDLVSHFKIVSMPTFMFFRNNKIVHVLKGADEQVLQTVFNVISGMNNSFQ